MLFAELGPLAVAGLLLILVPAGSAAGIWLANVTSRRGRPVDPHPTPNRRSAPVNKLKAVLCLIYVLSPIDLMPEAALGPLGLPDDIVAAIVGLRAWSRRRDG